MLLRVLFRCCLIVPLVWGAAVQFSYAQSTASLAEIKQSILSATGYDATTVEVTATPVQIVVTVVNSDLNGSLVTHHERETDAAEIVGAIAVTLASSPELAAMQAIHSCVFPRSRSRIDLWGYCRGNLVGFRAVCFIQVWSPDQKGQSGDLGQA